MAIKKVAYEFNPFKKTGVEVPKENREEALDEVKDYVLEKVLDKIGSSKSPVKNGNWKVDLTKEYSKEKSTQSSVNRANLELTGALLDALEVTKIGDKALSLQVEGDQAGKAEGNNLGTYGKKTPKKKNAREFIPTGRKTFTDDIWTGIRDILNKYTSDNSSPDNQEQFSNVMKQEFINKRKT